MRQIGGAGNTELQQLCSAYELAFARLREECRRRAGAKTAEEREAAGVKVVEAHGIYRECRDRLADYLIDHRRAEMQELAYRLWEAAGRPFGDPDGHWYRAESMLRGGGARESRR
jgi:hypothetical protein